MSDRTPPAGLVEHFEKLKTHPMAQDICEHLDFLKDLASRCDHITEFGMRNACSTAAFLMAQPDELISWDINPHSIVSNISAGLLSVAGRTRWQPRVGDTLKIRPIEQTDLLFIDSLHTGRQLFEELKRHCVYGDFAERGLPDGIYDSSPLRSVRRYLVFHDTQTFGYIGEDGQEPGLRGSIRVFQKNHTFPLWNMIHDFTHNNGLTVLERARP